MSEKAKMKKGTEVEWDTNGRGTSRTLEGTVVAFVPRGTAISSLKIAKKYKEAIPSQTKDLSNHLDRVVVEVFGVDGEEAEDLLVKVPKLSWLTTVE